ncbi:MBL fold metallo-hydrolase [Flavobacterium sp. AS60]|uniref:ComEC/Rec2 family competence protein n=1 Tax=Flavobacterium anseongense TaxID=2910677 RepID=UPI001F46ABC9|nr:MBL fold metallo-hydrolase [Flavobacterium sp. AS60]MCF6129326.1 MBL fold metallo-hydrolase [Flavobacterium sp. AS60]
MTIRFLKAFKGDSILITYEDSKSRKRNILIDGGTGPTYYESKSRKKGELNDVIDLIKEIDEKIDLLILTHIDDDHIGGILKWFSTDKEAHELITNIWFNSGKTIANYFESEENNELEIDSEIFGDNYTGIGQSKTFETYIEDNNIWEKKIILKGCKVEIDNIQIEILSPTKEKLYKLLKEFKRPKHDYFSSAGDSDWNIALSELINDEKRNDFSFDEDKSVANGSSIAFILTYEERKFIFLADSHPSVIIEALNDLGYSKENPIISELLKISHHASSRNTNRELLEIIETKNYVISSDGTCDGLPNKRTISRITTQNSEANIYFNYGNLIEYIISDQDRKSYPDLNFCSISEYKSE